MTNHLSVIETESQRFLDAVLAAAPEAKVPTCPDWTAADLLWHLTEVHAYWAEILRSGAITEDESEAVEAAKPERPAGLGATAALFTEQTGLLLAELDRRKDEEPAWFWLETAQTVGSTRRMQAHEATMHRLDAEFAAGWAPSPIAADLAAEGIEHAVNVMWAWWGTLPGFVFTAREGSVELLAEDLGRRWLLQPGRWTGVGQSGTSYDEPGVVIVDDGTPTAQVQGSAEALYRWLWGRGDAPAFTGDEGALAALREARDQGMD